VEVGGKTRPGKLKGPPDGTDAESM
jgi:hypothetical protein